MIVNQPGFSLSRPLYYKAIASDIKIAIDLVWWRIEEMGGVESYCKNLLKGLDEYSPENFSYILFTAKDNCDFIKSLVFSKKFEIKTLNTKSKNKIYTMFYQHFVMNKIAMKSRADLLFIPTPIYPIKRGKVPTVVTIHDLQFMHFPEYATHFQRIKYKWCWKNALSKANRIIAISNFVKQDIIEKFDRSSEKIEVIYNPVVLDQEMVPFNILKDKFRIKPKQYMYTVSSMAPHKNLSILIRLVAELKKRKIDDVPNKLVITGIEGSQKGKLLKLSSELGVVEDLVITGFIPDSERNCLYKNAYAFLFPSTFEGFGMPPVEAMILGIPVITTKCASIPEITQNKAIYVEKPYDLEEWFEKINEIPRIGAVKYEFNEYSLKNITNQYLALFETVVNGY